MASENVQPITFSSWSLISSIGMFLIGVAFVIYAVTYFLRPPQAASVVYPSYQIVQLGDQQDNRLFLVHTNGGHVWKQVCFGGDYRDGKCTGMMIWKETYVENLTPPENPISKEYTDIVAKVSPQETPAPAAAPAQ